jgi:DNA polymerase elongation subunit (family B)
MYISGYITFRSTFLMMDIANMWKSLEAKEPSINNHVYPMIPYPEVYILDGGYCIYVQEFGCYAISTITNVDFRVMYPGIYMIIHGAIFSIQNLAHIWNTLH